MNWLKNFIDDAVTIFFTTRIAISRSIPAENRHAVLFVKTKEGGQLAYGVRADRPHLLKKPSRATLKDIFEQVELMDMVPISLNVTLDGSNEVYSLEHVFPAMSAQYAAA